MKLIESPDTVIVEPASPASACVIWMHGLGADGHDFVPIVRELRLPAPLSVRFVFPHAPVRPVTLNGGMAMRAWFDIVSLDRKGLQDEPGIRASQARIDGLIAEQERAGIPTRRIVIAGFSQGGAIALQTALRHSSRLGGAMALSTYLPLADSLATEGQPANRDLPILMAHGQFDSVLPLTLGEWSRDQLKSRGYAVDWHPYAMAHEVCAEQIDHIAAWLALVLRD